MAQRRPRGHPGTSASSEDSDRRQYAAALSALTRLAAAPDEGDLRVALRAVAADACDVLAIERCAVFVADDPRELFVGCAAHPGAELEAAVRRLALGGPSDRFTREILERRVPLLIRDARADPRAQTAAIRAWKLRSLLGVPIVAGAHMLGLLTFDNGAELHRYAPVDLEVATAFAAFAGSLLARDRETGSLRASLEVATRQNRLLRRTALAEHRLSDAILSGGGLGAIVELVGTLSGKPTTLYDARGHVVAAGASPGGEPPVTLLQDGRDDATVRTVLDDVVAGGSATIEPTTGVQARRRHLAAPVDVRGERWGWLVMMERPSRLVAFDDFLIRRAATHLALELAGRRAQNPDGVHARSLLAGRLLHGSGTEDELRRGAESLGVSVDVPRLVACLTASPEDVGVVVEAVRTLTGRDVLVAEEPDGRALLIELPADASASTAARRVTRCLRGALQGTGGAGRRAGVSGVCRGLTDLPGGHRVARQVARCAEIFPLVDRPRVLAAGDLGPGRLFVADGHPEEIERFVDDVLGPLLSGDESCLELLRTIEAFYDTGRSVRVASEKLGVHENTVRYRLSRVHAITGLDVAADADDQLSVQIALLVLRLRGHPALHGFDEAIADDVATPDPVAS